MKLFRTDYPLTPSIDLVRKSITLLKKNVWATFYLIFLPGLVLSVGSVMLQRYISPEGMIIWNNQSYTGLGLMLIGLIWQIVTVPGARIMQLQAARGKTPGAFECFKLGVPRIIPLLIAGLLIGFAVLLGTLALIVPGLFLLRSFYLAPFYVVDQGLRPIEALKKSRAESLPNAGYIWGVIGITVLFAMAGQVISRIPVAGAMLELAIVLLYSFAPATRYLEIKKQKLSDKTA